MFSISPTNTMRFATTTARGFTYPILSAWSLKEDASLGDSNEASKQHRSRMPIASWLATEKTLYNRHYCHSEQKCYFICGLFLIIFNVIIIYRKPVYPNHNKLKPLATKLTFLREILLWIRAQREAGCSA